MYRRSLSYIQWINNNDKTNYLKGIEVILLIGLEITDINYCVTMKTNKIKLTTP